MEPANNGLSGTVDEADRLYKNGTKDVFVVNCDGIDRSNDLLLTCDRLHRS